MSSNSHDNIVADLLLNRYRVESVLGAGGLGSVVRATDTKLHRTVAIKTILQDVRIRYPDRMEAFAERFEREAFAGARVAGNSHLVSVYDLDRDATGNLFLVLEYVAGGSLKDRLQAGPLPLATALRLTKEIALGLTALHEHGIVHRDIKPANIFLTVDGHAKVGDLGIAQVDDDLSTSRLSHTHPGTPLYMSPEQEATLAYLTPESDQYSVGLVLFEMLTGKLYKRLHAHQRAAELATFPEAVEALIARMTYTAPSERYAGMASVVVAIEAIETIDRTASTAPTARERTRPLPSTETVTEHAVGGDGDVREPDPTPTRQTRGMSRRAVMVGAAGATAAVVVGGVALRRWESGVAMATSTAVGASPTNGPGSVVVMAMRPTAAPIPPTSVSAPLPAPDVRTFMGHTDKVYSVIFAPDGQTLASGSADTTIKLWRASDGTLLRTLMGHADAVYSIAFSSDGQTLASGSGDTTIKLWQVSDGTDLRTLMGHTDKVYAIAVSPDGQTLASGADDNTIKLWRVNDGALLRTLMGHTSFVVSVGFAPDGQTLASGADDKTIKLWRVNDGTLLRTLMGHMNSVWSVTFAPDGQMLASGSADKTIMLWRASDGVPLHTLMGHTDIVTSVALSPDGQTLASGSADETIKLWRVSDGTDLRTLMGHADIVTSVALSPDGQTLASGSADKAVKLWRIT